MNELSIHIDTSTANYPKVRLLVDGDDLLASTGIDEGNDPADILDTDALLPQSPPRRIAFYGCGCGEFGCANVTGLVVDRSDHVAWTDFRSLTGAYHSALPDPGDGPDPAAMADRDLPSQPLDVPTLKFDRNNYLAVVRAATANRGWETRPRAVIRHLNSSRPGMNHWAAHDGDRISVHHSIDGMAWSTDLALPPGPPDRLAASLIALLEQGIDPRRIDAENLWQ